MVWLQRLRHPIRVFWLFLILCLFSPPVFAAYFDIHQVPDSSETYVILRNVIITGNKKTRAEIIQRELPFKKLDTLLVSALPDLLASGKQNVFNTNLFNFVTADTMQVAATNMVDIVIHVVERWYIWPIPFLELSERNFNVWWETRDLSRLSYGFDLTFHNVRGRNETLKLLAHFGYDQVYGFNYRIPYINPKQTIGLKFGFDYSLNHEVAVFTRNNATVYLKDNAKYLRQDWAVFADLLVRPDLFNTHTIHTEYSQLVFDEKVDTIPGFLISETSPQKILTLSWFFKNDHRDVQYYPLKGYYADFTLSHSFPYNLARNSYFNTNLRYYLPIWNSRWYFAAGFAGKLTFAKQQPYYLQRGLGFGRDYVRGYEYYVIDAQHFVLLKTNLKFALVPQRVTRIGFLNAIKFNTIPWALYLNAFSDAGYSYKYPQPEPNDYATGNTLENKFLMGFGLGLDFSTYYDVVIRMEYTINALGQTGFYLHFVAPI